MRRARRGSEKTVYQQQDREFSIFNFCDYAHDKLRFISLDCSENNKKSK
jgi:hypothetical protein